MRAPVLVWPSGGTAVPLDPPSAHRLLKAPWARCATSVQPAGGGEDVDFCLQLGARLVAVPEAAATHPWWPQRRPQVGSPNPFTDCRPASAPQPERALAFPVLPLGVVTMLFHLGFAPLGQLHPVGCAPSALRLPGCSPCSTCMPAASLWSDVSWYTCCLAPAMPDLRPLLGLGCGGRPPD